MSAPGDVTRSRRWQRVRLALARTLPRPCPYCGHPVEAWHRWDVDHYALPRAHGGTWSGLRPAHARCNRTAGGGVRRRQGTTAAPSRSW